MRILAAMVSCVLVAGVAVAQDADDAERRIIDYVQDNMKAGEPLIVSKLYNEVFTAPEERAVLDKLNGAFFRIPLFILEFESRQGALPTLNDIAGQFDFYGDEEASVVLSVMEKDPRVPNFIERDPNSGELISIDEDKVKADKRFNQAVERSLTGWEGRTFPQVSGVSYEGVETHLAEMRGKAMLVYVWFTNCPPCVKIAPELVSLQEKFGGDRFTVVGLNSDKVLKLKYDDAYRTEYAQKVGVNYPNLHLTDEVRAALGNVNIFPTLFLVDDSGTIVKHFVNYQSREVLGPAIEETLSSRTSEDR